MSSIYCHRGILILLMWMALFVFCYILVTIARGRLFNRTPVLKMLVFYSLMISRLLAPFIGWVADVKLGRYKVILYGTLVSFAASIPLFLGEEIFTHKIISDVISCVAVMLSTLGYLCYSMAMLPFMTDQLVGANARDLSAVVHWFYWITRLSNALVTLIICSQLTVLTLNTIAVLACAVLLAVIIISDCSCQHYLDRTHKVTNPIKLIMQVLNYTRKHSYPERRSAFTYLDEDQPTRIDFGKDKFGGPFTEEEVEDVKTFLQLLPLLACASLFLSGIHLWQLNSVYFNAFESQYLNCVVNDGVSSSSWTITLLAIPVYQLVLVPLFHKYIPNMLRCAGAGLFITLFGATSLTVLIIIGYNQSGHFTRYLTCQQINGTEYNPDNFVEWYWKLSAQIIYSIGSTISGVLFLEFAFAQSPDKMKGLVMGLVVAFQGVGEAAVVALRMQLLYTICYDLPVFLLLTILLVVVLIFSKRYTLRERNREINIQAIVEEHYERYMDQEEEYMRENQLISSDAYFTFD